jgi:hypothetical protein
MLGDISVVLGLLAVIGGAALARWSYVGGREAFNALAARMAVYMLALGIAVMAGGAALAIFGWSRYVAWLSHYRDTYAYLLPYMDYGEPATIFGFRLPYTPWQYDRAFRLSEGITMCFAAAFVLGVYIVWGSAAALARRDFSVSTRGSYIWGMIYGVCFAVLALVLGYNWLNWVVRQVY